MASSTGDRGYIHWKPDASSRQLVDDILTIVHYYRDGGYPPPTARDVYYDLLGWFGEERGYTKGNPFQRSVYRFLSKMRRVASGPYSVGFDEITDDSSHSQVRSTFTDVPTFWGAVDAIAKNYQKDLTTNQPKRIKVYTEGAGAVAQFNEVAKDYTIPVYSPGGWDSLGFKHETASGAVEEYKDTARQTIILHAGDFDADGVALFNVFCEDVWAFVYGEMDDAAPEDVITFERVMLHADQVAENKRTPYDRATLKSKNFRGKNWPHDWKAELQALTLVERLGAMRAAIENHVDLDQLEADKQASGEEREEIKEVVDDLLEDEE